MGWCYFIHFLHNNWIAVVWMLGMCCSRRKGPFYQLLKDCPTGRYGMSEAFRDCLTIRGPPHPRSHLFIAHPMMALGCLPSSLTLERSGGLFCIQKSSVGLQFKLCICPMWLLSFLSQVLSWDSPWLLLHIISRNMASWKTQPATFLNLHLWPFFLGTWGS